MAKGLPMETRSDRNQAILCHLLQSKGFTTMVASFCSFYPSLAIVGNGGPPPHTHKGSIV
eukprot:scaffold28279_cov83-Skeletonema_dohrnii-CCMP3373.AAC.2